TASATTTAMRPKRRRACWPTGMSGRWVVDVALHRVGERQVELVGERCQPRENVAELMQLLFGRALAHRLRELTELLAQPSHRRRDAAGAVVVAVEAFHQVLYCAQLHDVRQATSARVAKDAYAHDHGVRGGWFHVRDVH